MDQSAEFPADRLVPWRRSSQWELDAAMPGQMRIRLKYYDTKREDLFKSPWPVRVVDYIITYRIKYPLFLFFLIIHT